jgi:hypothetical protein
MVEDTVAGKPRGYAFVEFEHERHMRGTCWMWLCSRDVANRSFCAEAYKYANGKKIDNRRVVVDVERGRLDPQWKPRRLGGGLGTTRAAKGPKCVGVAAWCVCCRSHLTRCVCTGASRCRPRLRPPPLPLPRRPPPHSRRPWRPPPACVTTATATGTATGSVSVGASVTVIGTVIGTVIVIAIESVSAVVTVTAIEIATATVTGTAIATGTGTAIVTTETGAFV